MLTALCASVHRRDVTNVATELTPHGPIVHCVYAPLKEGGTFELAVQRPIALLHLACCHCPPFASPMKSAVEAGPPEVALYADEVTLGQTFGQITRRFHCVLGTVLKRL